MIRACFKLIPLGTPASWGEFVDGFSSLDMVGIRKGGGKGLKAWKEDGHGRT